jgi:hypothetical protein
MFLLLHFVSCLFGGDFSLRSAVRAIAVGAGFRVMGLFGARHFAHFHGGNSSGDSSAH